MPDRKLPQRTRVVIIGGGAIGCSVAYHLGHLGWTDAVLPERDRLTSGTTWHAAGLMTSFGETPELQNHFVAAGLNSIGLITGGGLAMIEAGQPIDKAYLEEGEWEVDIVGTRYPAPVSLRPRYDPKSERVKA